MDKRFRDRVEALHRKYQELFRQEPVTAERVIPKETPVGGVYLFSEGGEPLYVGRTKRQIGTRIKNHFSTAPDCPFAWLLAREATGKRATYKPAGSRKDLLASPKFRAQYDRAKRRIRRMDVRYVHEPEPTSQALLEIYVAVATASRYNSFDTH